jgi:hypothetical protein
MKRTALVVVPLASVLGFRRIFDKAAMAPNIRTMPICVALIGFQSIVFVLSLPTSGCSLRKFTSTMCKELKHNVSVFT